MARIEVMCKNIFAFMAEVFYIKMVLYIHGCTCVLLHMLVFGHTYGMCLYGEKIGYINNC